jgi:hypothetical protein
MNILNLFKLIFHRNIPNLSWCLVGILVLENAMINLEDQTLMLPNMK